MASRWTKKRKVDADVQRYMSLIASEGGSVNEVKLCHDANKELKTDEASLQNSFVATTHATSTCEHEVEHSTVGTLTDVQLQLNVNDCCSEYSSDSMPEFESSDTDSLGCIENSLDTEVEDTLAEGAVGLIVREELCSWAVECNIALSAVTRLLGIMRKLDASLPKDARTLLKTRSAVKTRAIAGGEYCHIGVADGILTTLSQNTCNPGAPIAIQVNVDGLPIFRSTGLQLWPILGRIHNVDELFASPIKDSYPFVIGVYQGRSKPTDVAEFLHDFVEDAKTLESSPVVHNKNCMHSFKIAAIICDMPARSLIKCVKGHGAYGGCDRCTQHGLYDGKVTFPLSDAPLRTDSDFDLMVDEEYHVRKSPLCNLSLGMVTNFPIDYMHAVCLGVARKLVYLWHSGPLRTRLGTLSKAEINDKLMSYTPYIPQEFARKPRTLVEFERWKATEYRTFLLYSGPVCLQTSLPSELYSNFLLLCVAVTILLSPALCSRYADYSCQLLMLFVKHFGELYGTDKITYNVHALIHISDDAKLYGVLDNVSAFPFENYLGKMKKMIRQPRLPLQQVVRRLCERKSLQAEKSRNPAKCHQPLGLHQVHSEGPTVSDLDIQQQYKQMDTGNFIIKLTSGDRHVQLKRGHVVAVQNIVTDMNSNVWLIYRKFHDTSDFFSYPMPSKELGIFRLGYLAQGLHHCPITDVLQKYVVLPCKSGHVGIPLLHCSQ